MLIGTSAFLCGGCDSHETPGPAAQRSPTDTSLAAGPDRAAVSAVSTFRAWRDTSGCLNTSTVNRRFTPILLHDTAARPRRLLLTETIELVACEGDELSGVATLSAKAAGFDERRIGPPAWTIEARSKARYLNEYRTAFSPARIAGAVFCCADLYVVTDFDGLATYHSLQTGAPLYVTSDTLIRVEIPDSRFRWRFVAFHDRLGATIPPEAARDSNVVGVLQYGDEQRSFERLAIVSDGPLEYEAADTKLLIAGSESEYAWPLHRAARAIDRRRIEGFSVVVELHESRLRDAPPLATIVVPVVADEFDVANARVPKGMRLRR